MMYQNKFVATVKVGKDILREDKDTVLLPFGSEYSIYMKNLEGRTAVVSISLDGQDVLDGNEIVLRPNKETILEGFMKDAKVDAKFKFIQKTAKIQEYRGDRIDDGLLRISFRFEKPRSTYTPPLWTTTATYQSATHHRAGGMSVSKGGYSGQDVNLNSRGIDVDEGSCNASSWTTQDAGSGENPQIKSCVTSNAFASTPLSAPRAEEGITVRGSDSSQTFQRAIVGELETEVHVIVMKLMGVNPETTQPIEQPLTVRTKKECPTCGTTNKSSMKFCGDCGTRLD